MSEAFDAIIVGAGQAGPALAGRLTAAGMRVAIIERKHVGGTCVNTGCKPTKTLVASAYAAHLARRAADYGVTLGGGVGVDMTKLMARKDAVALGSRRQLEAWLEGMERCRLVRGHARLTSPRTVDVDGTTFSAERIFLNVGGRAVVPTLPGIDKVATLTNRSILELTELPEHLVIVGGSYIGLEFAQMFCRFGSKVTVIEKGPRLIGREDEDVSAEIRSFLEAEGIAIRLDAECIHFSPHSDGVSVGVDCTTGAPEVAGTHVLLAMGRQPNTDDLGLDAAGVKADGRGFVVTDDELKTDVEGIWALGECNGRGAFTHTAYNDFEIVAANLLDEGRRSVRDRIPAYALFVDPPLGRAGMTEAEALRSGRRVLAAKRLMTEVGRAVEKGETYGFMKVLVDADSKEILGAGILGTGGDEVVHALLDVMYVKAPYTVVERAMHIHPTVAELLPTLLGALKPLASASGA